ncbi:MAG TPA: AAA family ATPase [Polyangium sp.]|nr:AAA family ATPase [Polyangium sp.]
MTESSPEQPVTSDETSAPPRRWLERLKINQFRSVEPGTELRFSDGLHVVLGKNATGKSTLLDLIAAALDLDFDQPRFRHEPLDLEFVLRAGPYEIEAAVKRIVNPETPRRGVRRKETPDSGMREEGRYTVRAPGALEITVVLASNELPKRLVNEVDAAKYGAYDVPVRLHQTPPLAPTWNSMSVFWLRFWARQAAVAELFEQYPFETAHVAFLVRMFESDELLEAVESDKFEVCIRESIQSYPRVLPNDILVSLPTDGSPIDASLEGEPMLAKFVHEIGFDEARLFFGPPRVERQWGSDTFVYSKPTFTFHRNGRLARRGDQLSYGQRRLFALAWYLACNKEIAILDEPSNGLHESWVEFLVSQLQGRQVFLTSQNRELLDMLPFHSENELARGFVLCESRPQPQGGEPTLHWRGLRDEEAELMIKAFRASRVDLVTDLLRGLNLW